MVRVAGGDAKDRVVIVVGHSWEPALCGMCSLVRGARGRRSRARERPLCRREATKADLFIVSQGRRVAAETDRHSGEEFAV